MLRSIKPERKTKDSSLLIQSFEANIDYAHFLPTDALDKTRRLRYLPSHPCCLFYPIPLSPPLLVGPFPPPLAPNDRGPRCQGTQHQKNG